MVSVAVTAPRAVEAFRALAARYGVEVIEAPMVTIEPAPIDPYAVISALRESDLALFATGSAAYRIAQVLKEAGLLGEASRLLANLTVATIEGEKGAIMIKNAFGTAPKVVASSAEELQPLACRRAAVFHYGWRDPDLLSKVKCEAFEFQPYTARPPPRETVDRALGADAVVFASALAVRFFAEVGGEDAVELLKGKIVVAAGPAVSRALRELGVPHLTAPRGRIGPLAQYVVSLLLRRGAARA
ncbi:uroporphyrinogen-III synthase HemD [Thermoproteus tenax Kra 1]|uniref:Uroporphyrinogen-III synthase HemD n=1 Tax=Thermoproteus tenax (strain ATCC 35583 / DSM 2078 / JCM 9277 / NBRC 100435 / Kra 1) TaxID=768679 RepID=G4RNC5_THETK|nr:uroporphyrinogen-III synthase HemD [Thermoproteus tenax Kra 1]